MAVAQAKLYVAAAEELLKGDPDGPREAVRAAPREARMAGRHRRAGLPAPVRAERRGPRGPAGGGPPPERGRPQGAEEAP